MCQEDTAQAIQKLARLIDEINTEGRGQSYIVFCPYCPTILKFKDSGYECGNGHRFSSITVEDQPKASL